MLSTYVADFRVLKINSRAQFAKRDVVYFNSNSVKNQDAFIILCNITSSPTPPPPPPPYCVQTVPNTLLETVGALLNDPLYSDVEFVVPGRRGDIKSARKILACKTLLRRADYFESSKKNKIIFCGGAPNIHDLHSVRIWFRGRINWSITDFRGCWTDIQYHTFRSSFRHEWVRRFGRRWRWRWRWRWNEGDCGIWSRS